MKSEQFVSCSMVKLYFDELMIMSALLEKKTAWLSCSFSSQSAGKTVIVLLH
jgi:hypothetical protein